MNRCRSLFGLLLWLAAVAISLPACTTGFERRWTASAGASDPGDPFSGRWEGTWRSEKHRGASGRLRCVFTRLDARRYDAHFKANWMLFATAHRTVFDAEGHAGKLRFRGRHDLGALFGGVYTYLGEATPAHFAARYDSSYDRGTFSMARRSR